MKDGRRLSSSTFQDEWERSLRRETALQDEYRRAICVESGGAASDTGFDRWNAASCLQEQFDSARGVEITRRLAKSRAIDARFSRRSVMKDLQGTDLDTTVANPGLRGEACISPPPGRDDKSLDGEASPTRGEALERLGIDLGRVGVMTTARTNSRQSLAAPAEESPRTGRVRQEGKASNNSDGLRMEENRGRKRNRGGAFAATSRGSESGAAAAAAAAAAKKNQEQLTEKLRELNALLASEPLDPPAAANCEPSKPEHNNNPGRTRPKFLLSAGGIEKETGGFSSSVDGIHDDAVMDSTFRGDVSPRRNHQIPARSARRDDLPRIRARGVATKEDVAAIDGQDPQRACSDVERAPEECAQTEAPVIPKLNIDGRGSSIETLSPKEDAPLKLDAKGLPNHRPCWWWMPLLASGAEGISIPDTVTLAPSFLLDEAGASADRGHGGSKTRASVAKSQLTTTAAAAGSRRMALLWAFSGSGPATDSRGTDSTISKTLGGIAVDGELSDAEVASSHAVGLGQDELEARRDRRLPAAAVASPLQRLHSQTLVGDESMLCAARAICECGRRGGGGAGGDLGGGERSKLPLAVLKIWGRESEEERGRQRSLAGEEQRLKRRGRRLRVMSLWTETEVLEALRDMAKGKWGRPARGSADARCSPVTPPKADKTTATATAPPPKTAATSSTPSKTAATPSVPSKTAATPSGPSSKTRTTPSAVTSEGANAPMATPTSRAAADSSSSGPYAYLSAHDEDTCCVQAFVKSAGYASTASAAATAAAAASDLSKTEILGRRVPGSAAHVAAVVGSDSVVGGGAKDVGKQPLTSLEAVAGVTDSSGRSDTFKGRSEHVSGGCRGAAPNPVPGTGRRRRRTAAASFCGPVFYRALWRRTGKKLCVWKVTSRYPYMSNLASHLCPLVGAGSVVPFMAVAADGGAFATAAAKTGSLVKALQLAYDPTLQRLWADWAVNEVDGQWFLVEVHGLKTDTDVRKAAEARKAALVAAAAQSKVLSAHGVPSTHFCGDPDDLRARIAAANPTQEICLVEMSERLKAPPKRQPRRPRTPSKVSQQTRKKLARRGASNSEKAGLGERRMANQYWRCAGDFCETRAGGRRASDDPSGRENGMPSEGTHPPEAMGNDDISKYLDGGGSGKSNRGDEKGGGGGDGEGGGGGERGVGGGGEGGGGGGKVMGVQNHKKRGGGADDVVGRRKHALSVETPRTVLFRLVLNARAALLGWKATAADFSQMEKPVQLCSACYTVCAVLDRERTERTRRAMEAEDNCFKAGKARRSRRPHGWKSRMQHELENSLGADRHAVYRLMDNFNAAAEQHRTRPTPRIKSVDSALAESATEPAKRTTRRHNDHSSSSPRGKQRSYRGGVTERALVKRIEVYPIPPAREQGAGAKPEPTPRSKNDNNTLAKSATATSKRAMIYDDNSSSSPRGGRRRRYRGRDAQRALVKRMDAYPILPGGEQDPEAKAKPTPRDKINNNASSESTTEKSKRAIRYDDSSSSPRGGGGRRSGRGRDMERALVKRMDAYPIPPVRKHGVKAKTEPLQSCASAAWSTPRQNVAVKMGLQRPSPAHSKTEASFVPKPPRPQATPRGKTNQRAGAAAAAPPISAAAAAAAAEAAEAAAEAATGTISISGRRVERKQGEELRQQQQQQHQQRQSKREVRARRKAKERERRKMARRRADGTEGGGRQSGSTSEEDSEENEPGGGLGGGGGGGGGKGGRRTRKGLPLVRRSKEPKSALLPRKGGEKRSSAEAGCVMREMGEDGTELEVIWNDDESYQEAVARARKAGKNKPKTDV